MSSRAYVFFDVDDTLLEWTTSWADVFAQVAGEAGVTVSVAQAWHLLRGAFAGVYAECVALHAPSGDARAFWEELADFFRSLRPALAALIAELLIVAGQSQAPSDGSSTTAPESAASTPAG